MLYRTMAILLGQFLLDALGGVALPGKVVTQGLLYALFVWFRRSELTADRAGLLVVQDPDICVSGLLKLVAGSQRLSEDLSTAEFIKQADTFDDLDEDMISLYYKFLMTQWQTHPFPAYRAREISEWGQSEAYERILRGDYPRTNADAGKRTCTACGTHVFNVTFRFCPECGATLAPVGATPSGAESHV
jgi:Zn-dependent protease with chaperone function